MAQFRHLLVPIDFSDCAKRALEAAIALSQGAQLTLLHVYELPVYPYPGLAFPVSDTLTPVERAAREALEQLVEEVRARVPDVRGVVRSGDPAQVIHRMIEELGVDLVVMGTHGRRGLSRALIGSVAEKTVRLSPVPVLCVPTAHDA